MKSHQRGFISLVAIILLGITAVVGGTIATVSIRNSNPKPSSEAGIKAEEPALAPVSARVESSATTTTSASSRSVKPHVEPIKAVVEKKAVLYTKSKEICDQIALVQIDTSKRSLTEDIRVLCERIGKGRYQEGDELETATTWLKEKWELWLQVQKAEEPAKNRAIEIETNRP